LDEIKLNQFIKWSLIFLKYVGGNNILILISFKLMEISRRVEIRSFFGLAVGANFTFTSWFCNIF